MFGPSEQYGGKWRVLLNISLLMFGRKVICVCFYVDTYVFQVGNYILQVYSLTFRQLGT